MAFRPIQRVLIPAFRNKVKDTPGPGASKKVVWTRLYIGTVIKYTVKRRVIEVVRWMTHGQWRKAKKTAKILKRRKKAEYIIHRAPEWDISRTPCFFHSEMPTCSFKN